MSFIMVVIVKHNFTLVGRCTCLYGIFLRNLQVHLRHVLHSAQEGGTYKNVKYNVLHVM